MLYPRNKDNPKVAEIKRLRSKLVNSTETVLVNDMGAGSVKLAEKNRKIRDIVAVSSITHKYGTLLNRLTSYLKPHTVLEMGTCLGLGTLYLATGNDGCRVITIEGGKALASKSSEHFLEVNQNNITVVNEGFDTALPQILANNNGFDVIFIDGNHTKEAVLRYFYTCLPYAKSNTVIVVDDIRWSAGMLEAWREICGEQKVKLSVDLFRLGLVFFNEKLQKEHFMIYY